MTRTRIARLLRRALFVSAVGVSAFVALAPLAAADPCPVLDPGCVLEEPTTTAGGVVDDTTTTAGGVVDDTTTTVGGVVEDTSTTVGGVVESVEPIDTGTIVPGGGGVVPGSGDTPPNSGGTTPEGGGQTGPPSSGTQAEPPPVVSVPDRVIPTPAIDASTTAGHPLPSFLDEGSGGSLLSGARLARTVAFPLVLVLLVIGFVFVQNRIDRRDPKLALAPVGPDYLTFS